MKPLIRKPWGGGSGFPGASSNNVTSCRCAGVRVIGYRCAPRTNALLLLRELVQPPWTTVGSFLKELNMHPPYKPAVPLLGVCPVEGVDDEEHLLTGTS